MIAWLFTLVYFASYVMRINFAVMLVKVCSDMALGKSDLAIVITALTVTYGIGQVISGFVGDKIKPQYMLTCGLALAIICNVAMFFCRDVNSMTAVWAINGLAHAMLWPPIVRLNSTYIPEDEYSYASVRVSWGSSIATILLYLGCPLLLSVMSWRAIILVCAGVGVVVMAVWLIASSKLLRDDMILVRPADKSHDGVKTSAYPAIPKFVILPIIFIVLGIVFQGMMRDGVTNWMPSFLLETFGLPEDSSILATVILAVFSIFSFWVFDLLYRKLIKNEVLCGGAIFGMALISAAALYIVNKFTSSVVASMLLMAVIVGCMHGVNLMLIAIVPKCFAKYGKVSTMSGLLNSCTYIGAAIATSGFAVLAEVSKGWTSTLFVWILICLVGTLVCVIAAPLWKRFKAR
ncbi:MAG: MFS transporter [Ruminococcaceae bacterium]|nr:MFS transporter [Oscillospiraceae bacterium]